MVKSFPLWLLVLVLGAFLLFSCQDRKTWDPGRDGEGLKRIFQLSTTEMVFHEVIYNFNESRWFFLTYGTKETLFSIDLRVQGGFDLADGYKVETKPQQKSVRMIFPAPKVLMVNADDRSIREYFTSGDPIGYLKLRDLLKDRSVKIEAEALRRGLLDRAKDQARSFAQVFFSSLGFSEVEVSFQESLPDKKAGEKTS